MQAPANKDDKNYHKVYHHDKKAEKSNNMKTAFSYENESGQTGKLII